MSPLRTKRVRTATVPIPTVWFAALVAVTGLALFGWTGRSWSALLVVEVVLAAIFLLDAARCPSPSAIEVTREMPESARVGDTIDLAWTIANTSSRPGQVTVTDALWPSLRARRRTVKVRLAGRQRVRMKTTLDPSRRGRFPLDEVTVRVTGPARLACRQQGRSVPGGLRVMPAYPSRDEVMRRVRIPRVLELGVRSIRSAGGGTEFDQLRDLRPDDEFRRIDWSSTMRLQRPIVKQFRTERNQTVILLLDNGRVMAGTVGGVPRVEHSMDAALGIVDAATHLGDRVGMLCFDRQVRSIVPANNAKSQMGRMAEAMYLLEPQLAESAYTTAFSLAATRFRRRSLYVVFTDLAEATVELGLLPSLPILLRRHLVVVAAVRDPEVTAWAAGGRHQWPSEVFREAAAIAALDQREASAAKLRAAGAVVVDTEPAGLAAALVDTYLTLKASGRL